MQATDKDGNDVTDKAGNAVYEKNKDGTYVCNPDTVPERVLAYRAQQRLRRRREGPRRRRDRIVLGARPRHLVANAMLQASRVAAARNLPLAEVASLVKAHTDDPQLGFLGEKTVNVLDLNLALDKLGH